MREMTDDELREMALKFTNATGLGQSVMKLARETLRLLDRPPMACLNCEELNLKLSEELDSVKRWQAAEEREALAWNSWLQAKETDEDFEELLKSVKGEKQSPEYVAKIAKEREKFEKWWANNKFFQ